MNERHSEQADLKYLATQMDGWIPVLRDRFGADTSALEPLARWARGMVEEKAPPGQRRDELALHLAAFEAEQARLKAAGLPFEWLDGPVNILWYHSKEDPENDPSLPGRLTWPGRDQSEAAEAKNRGVLLATGQRFHSGVFDALTGEVVEVKTYQATGYGERHHGEFLSRHANRMVNKGEGGYFFVHDNGYVYTQWRLARGDIAPGALERLTDQITVDGRAPRIFEERATGYAITRYEERTPAAGWRPAAAPRR